MAVDAHRRRRTAQLELPAPSTWGGRRAGAGRKRIHERPGPAHAPRPPHADRHPVHVTLRARRGVPSLRSPGVFNPLKRALSRATRRGLRL